MKSLLIKRFWMVLFSVILCFSCAGRNYKYVYKFSCSCIISKNNPAGITDISVFPYDQDSRIHEHTAGYYSKTSKNKVKRFNLVDFNPSDFSCQPCLTTLEPNQKYVFMFKGAHGKKDVSVKVFKDSKGVIRRAH